MDNLCHELNHYILGGCLGKEWSWWLGESFAQNAVDDVRPGNTLYLEYYGNIKSECTRARMITGMLWGDEWEDYPLFKEIPYTLGSLFLQYVKRWTTGETSGALWTEYFAEQTPGGLTNEALDAYLQKTTGESLEAWMAQFLAALITGRLEGPYAIGSSEAIEACRPDLRVFLRDYHDFGQYLTGFDPPGAADGSIGNRFRQELGFTAVSGGGTTFVYRNDKGSPISVTGADDRWYFFAVTMELPDLEEVIEISDVEALARIGNDPTYPLSGSYILTDDIDLAGSPENLWTPIGEGIMPFVGVFDGNGRTIEGLDIDSGYGYVGLFGRIGGDAVVRDLTIKGSLTGDEYVGGIVGYTNGGTVTNYAFSGTVTGRDYVGGIAGYHYLADMWDCCHTGPVSSEENVGGVCGGIRTGSIENCYSLCPGLPVEETFLESAILTSDYVLSDEPGGEDTLTAEEFTRPDSFIGWDFESIWSLENGVRPILRDNPEPIGAGDSM